jgi:1-deoxy-D-xylulose-5-phosphate synthase
MGGAGAAVAELARGAGGLHLGLPDAFIEHMSREQLLAQVGLDAAGIEAAVCKRWPKQPVAVRSATG